MSQTDEVEVLLVEDSENDAELTLRALKKHNLANKVLWVKDGAEALDFLIPPRAEPPGRRADVRAWFCSISSSPRSTAWRCCAG